MTSNFRSDDELVDRLRDFDQRLALPRYDSVVGRAQQARPRFSVASVALGIGSAAILVTAAALLLERSQTPAASASVQPTLTQPTRPASAPAGVASFGLLMHGNGDEIVVRSETSPTLVRMFRSRNYVVSPDGRRVAYWQTADEDMPPHVLHVLDLINGTDTVVVTLVDERAGSAGWAMWSSDGRSLAIAVHAGDSAFEGRLAPHLPTYSSVRIIDLSTRQAREVMRTTKGWLDPIAFSSTRGQVVAIVRGTDDRVVDYLVRDLTAADARSLPLRASVTASSVQADASGENVVGIERTSCPIGTCGLAWVWPSVQPANAQRATSTDVNALSAVFRPGTSELYSVVRDAGNASAIQRWSTSATSPAQIVRLPGLGRLVFRVDGSALIATQTDLNRRAAYLIDPGTGGITEIVVSSDPLAAVVLR